MVAGNEWWNRGRALSSSLESMLSFPNNVPGSLPTAFAFTINRAWNCTWGMPKLGMCRRTRRQSKCNFLRDTQIKLPPFLWENMHICFTTVVSPVDSSCKVNFLSKENWPFKRVIGLVQGYTKRDQAKIDLKAKMIFFLWPLQAGSTLCWNVW